PILTCVRNYFRVKQLFNVLRDINICLRKIVTKFSKVNISHCHIAAHRLPSIYGIEKLAKDIFDLKEMLLNTIVHNNKVHNHTTLNFMYKALEKLKEIQQKLFRNYATA
ncbi:MAG: hypothetical protein MJE68_23295, partial [Proteobacteria bacterium]|nr:hypothetical protein [Pseudomonadota bacterium]